MGQRGVAWCVVCMTDNTALHIRKTGLKKYFQAKRVQTGGGLKKLITVQWPCRKYQQGACNAHATLHIHVSNMAWVKASR